MDIYRELGVEPIINAAGTLTRMSGSLMPPEVVEAMVAASRAYVDMEELHLAAGRRIAEVVGAEAAHVCACAAAGISLMAAACMAGCDRARIRQLPNTHGLHHLFVVQRAHRNGFDQALQLAGGRFIEVEADADQLGRAAAGEGVAGVSFTQAWFCMGDSLPLPQVAELAHVAGVPLVVDAAAEVPPVDNLTRFLREGADLVTFSGGKAICGPQSTGFILGRADLIEACRLNDCPNGGVGRPMKTGKEDIIGLVKAIELYVQRDHAAEMRVWEERVAQIVVALSAPEHVHAWRQMPFGIGQQIPHVAVAWDEAALGITHEQAMQRLRQGRPRIALQLVNAERYGWGGYTTPELRIHPHTLLPGEAESVVERLVEVMKQSA
ncbi:MAG: aminotransferase class V-fold PLP-dependent enzyme [Chloroflexota bacterium]